LEAWQVYQNDGMMEEGHGGFGSAPGLSEGEAPIVSMSLTEVSLKGLLASRAPVRFPRRQEV
jgi:hypothetical protein